jgi:hypothetical protein
VSVLLPFVLVVFEVIEVFDFPWVIFVVTFLIISWASLFWILISGIQATLGWRVSRGKKMGQESSCW